MRAPSWRIVRRLRNGALRDVEHPLMPGVHGFSLHAPDADAALDNARKIIRDSSNLEVISESN